MSSSTKIIVGGGLQDDLAAFADAWDRAERGEDVAERVLSFGSWNALLSVMTDDRVRLLRHLHGRPEPSVAALADALGRDVRPVQADVVALESAGLIERRSGRVRATADAIQAEIRF